MIELGMATGDNYFVEWKEHFVSKERGKRVVHYLLKDSAGESVLAVVGTERSLRHMFYVVSEDFLKGYGAENSVHAGFRWRSRREVVNWLTSMLSKQHHKSNITESPEDGTVFRDSAERILMPDHEGRYSRSFRGRQTDIKWSGVPWSCGKQLTHYPAFSRNGISIVIHSFVYVMAEKENRYVAYLEDMYEDKKCQKKVRVRWFHHNREIRGVSLRNPHPKEVFITPHAQVISAECVDGPAVVLTHGHYEKCSTILPGDLLGRMHFCSRQFKSHRLKPFKLCKLRGYYDQPILSYFNSDFFKDEVSSGAEVTVGRKRARSGTDHQLLEKEPLYQKLRYDIFGKRLDFHKHVGEYKLSVPIFKVNDKIESLCQDSGIRGCWFKSTILEVSRRLVKIQYDDLKDEDGFTSLEEWIPSCKLASPDKLGIRYSGRPTIRPARPCQQEQDDLAIMDGTPVDAWWCDGWWEGFVVGGISISDSEGFQVYSPGENLLLHVAKSNLRVSRDWVGDRWIDIDMNPDILAVISATISMDAKLSISSTKETNFHDSPLMCHGIHTSSKLSIVEEEAHEQAEEKENEECMKDKASINSEQQHDQTEDEKKKKKDEDTQDENIKRDSSLMCSNSRSVASLSDNDNNNDDDLRTMIV
ncbi:hypothetical protein LIER_25085 [Lithospermum erythrorhizon]|uniref:BAH domain-containing protein n=1 Tax=Lithospermum erythrorhizon TaxID=34254 RepID=A0AAV3R3B4_LITER